MNRVELVGGLTRPIAYDMDGPVKRASMTLAVNGATYDYEQRAQVVTTAYVTCEARGVVAEFCAQMHLGQGDEVHVLGEIAQVHSKDKDRPSTRIRVLTVSPTRVTSGGSTPDPSDVATRASTGSPQSNEPPF